MTVRIGSLCTGYGGLDMAVQQVFGGDLAWVSDIDPGACQIIAHRHPEVPNLGDLTAVDWDQVEPVDIVCGGYPCQPFSLAGDLKGTSDERHIWPDIARALGVLRPRLAIFENVANHLRLGFDTVLGDLAALGFNAEWCLVRASDVGAAHQRKRLIFLAWSTDTPSPGREGHGVPGWAAERGVTTANAHSVGGNGDRACGGRRDEPAARRLSAADTACVGTGEPADKAQPLADRGDARQVPSGGSLRAAANANRDALREQPERQPRRGGTAITELTGTEAPADARRGGLNGYGELPAGRDALQQRLRNDADGRDPASADTASVGRGEGRPEPTREQGGSGTPVGSAPNWGDYGPAIARWERIIGRPAPSPTNDLGRLNPPFVEWLMGLPAGHVTDVPGLSRTAQLKALGNGVVPQQAQAAIRLLTARAAA